MCAAELINRALHFDRVAGDTCQRLVHVGEKRQRGQACCTCCLDKRMGKLARLRLLGHEGA
jgi:hypothetical protein